MARRLVRLAKAVFKRAFSSTVFIVRGRCGPRISQQLCVLKPTHAQSMTSLSISIGKDLRVRQLNDFQNSSLSRFQLKDPVMMQDQSHTTAKARSEYPCKVLLFDRYLLRKPILKRIFIIYYCNWPKLRDILREERQFILSNFTAFQDPSSWINQSWSPSSRKRKAAGEVEYFELLMENGRLWGTCNNQAFFSSYQLGTALDAGYPAKTFTASLGFLIFLKLTLV